LATAACPAIIAVPMPPSPNGALASFVLSPPKRANGRSLDDQWDDLASFLKGPASVLLRWLAVGQMYLVYKAMKRHRASDAERLENLTMRHFVERAIKATGVSRPTIYRTSSDPMLLSSDSALRRYGRCSEGTSPSSTTKISC
jgi:hypothetical protein